MMLIQRRTAFYLLFSIAVASCKGDAKPAETAPTQVAPKTEATIPEAVPRIEEVADSDSGTLRLNLKEDGSLSIGGTLRSVRT